MAFVEHLLSKVFRLQIFRREEFVENIQIVSKQLLFVYPFEQKRFQIFLTA